MTKVIMILLLAALACSAGMIPGGPCAVDTYVNYGALGTAGCTIEGRLFVFQNTACVCGPIPLTVTPNDSGSDASVGLTFAGSLPLGPSSPAVSIEYAVTATSANLITRARASFSLGAMSTGAALIDVRLHQIGGANLEDIAAENPPFAAKTETLPPLILTVKALDFVNQFQITTSPSDFSVISFTNTFLNAPSDPQTVAPEPCTLALAGAGALLLLAGRKLRGATKSVIAPPVICA